MLTSATGEELTSAHHATETYSHASDIFLGLSLRSWYEFCFTLSKNVFSLGGLFKDILGLPPQPTLQTISKFGQSDRHSVSRHWCTWIWTNTFCNLCKIIVILAYTICKLDKYILQDGKCGKIHFWFSKFGSLAGSLWPSIDALKLGNLGLDHNSFSRK